jgi:hypothetical protein
MHADSNRLDELSLHVIGSAFCHWLGKATCLRLNFGKRGLKPDAWPMPYKPHWSICVNPRAFAVEIACFLVLEPLALVIAEASPRTSLRRFASRSR